MTIKTVHGVLFVVLESRIMRLRYTAPMRAIIIIGALTFSLLACNSTQPIENQAATMSSSSQSSSQTSHTAEITTMANGWSKYHNNDYGFEFEYPPHSTLSHNAMFSFSVSVELPYTPKTKIERKNMTISIQKHTTPEDCFGQTAWHGETKINDIDFHYIPGVWEHASGGLTFYASDYTTMHHDTCVMLTFRLGMRDSSGFVENPTPVPEPPEKDLDTNVFDTMLSTFKFTD